MHMHRLVSRETLRPFALTDLGEVVVGWIEARQPQERCRSLRRIIDGVRLPVNGEVHRSTAVVTCLSL
jgi:hypothetical protein